MVEVVLLIWYQGIVIRNGVRSRILMKLCIGTVHYLRAGGAEILRGALIFGKSPMGGHLFLARKILKKPVNPTFPRVSGKNKTKKFFYFS